MWEVCGNQIRAMSWLTTRWGTQPQASDSLYRSVKPNKPKGTKGESQEVPR